MRSFFALALGLFLVACTKTADRSTTSPALFLGKSVYQKNCAVCHQVDGVGTPGVFPPLLRSDWVKGNPKSLARLLLLGAQGEFEVAGKKYQGAMPSFARLLSDAEIAAVLTYVRTTFGGVSAPVEELLVSEQRKLFAQRQTPWNGAAELKAAEKENP